MPGNSIGERFRVTTFGESHGAGLGAVIDGCPAGHPFPFDQIARQLERRRPGQSRLTTQRKESDHIETLSGVDPVSQLTLGTPIALLVRNHDVRSDHYRDIESAYRPSHADYSYDARFGIRAVAGGGRASARETVARVASGTLAEDLLLKLNIKIVAWVHQIGHQIANSIDETNMSRELVDKHETRCPDSLIADQMSEEILQARKANDSLGGVVRCVAYGVPAGWGEPVFSKLSSELAGAMMSLPASRGFEIGEGFSSASWTGSQHNDPFYCDDHGKIRTKSNHSGGIQGGISNGEAIRIAVAFKPVATIFRPQETVTREGKATVFQPKKGRHDPCVVPRAVPMVEAMMAIILCDHMLRSQGVRAGSIHP